MQPRGPILETPSVKDKLNSQSNNSREHCAPSCVLQNQPMVSSGLPASLNAPIQNPYNTSFYIFTILHYISLLKYCNRLQEKAKYSYTHYRLRYNLSGRERDLVIIRMIGSFHLIWKKIYCCWTKPPHYSQHLNGFLFFSLIQCLVWMVTGPLFWYLEEPCDSLLVCSNTQIYLSVRMAF